MSTKTESVSPESWGLKERLESLPGEIRSRESKVLAFSNKVNSLKSEITKREVMIAFDIKKEKVSVEKDGVVVQHVRFKNESERKVELNNRLGANVEYQANVKELNDVLQKKALEEIELVFLKRLFSAAKSLVRLGVGE